MTGKGREVAHMMERRKRNGVGGILKEEYSKSVVEVKRVSDRVMIMTVEVEGMMINVISAYAPQLGCEMEEKERIWSELDEVVDGVPRKERLVIGADFNGHIGEGNRGDEEVMCRYGFKERNVEGQMVVDFAKRMKMAGRCNLKEIGDCKVLAGDSVARQHRMVVCRMVLEAKKKKRRKKYREGQKELHCGFVDLEKAYDRVPRDELWYCMRKSGVSEKYVRVVQDMYEDSVMAVKCAVGTTDWFRVKVGLHQGSALSPFLFAVVMDRLMDEVRQESPWTMMFADDIVICGESREQVEKSLERWRYALERIGMKVSRSKTEYMCVNEREGSGVMRWQGEEVEKVEEFGYLGSTVQRNRECVREVKKRVQAGWSGWRRVAGVICDSRVSAKVKGKVYRSVVRPAMLYGLETVALHKRQEVELEAILDFHTDMDIYTSSVLDYINTCIDNVTTVKHVKCFPNQKPWMNSEVRLLLKARDAAFKSGSAEDYNRARSNLKRGIRKAKLTFKRHIEEHFHNSDPRRMWKGIQSITDYKPTAQPTSSAFQPNELNHFFARFDQSTGHFTPTMDSATAYSPLSISTTDVYSVFSRVDARKAAGPDGIPGRVLRACAGQLAQVFTDIFNLSLAQATVPTCLKTTTIVPVPKHSAAKCLNDFRPVALTPIAMKCFEKLVLNHLTAGLPPTLDPHQYAYRPNRSTEDAVSTALHSALTHLDKSNTYIRMLFIDFSSAFNTVLPTVLITKLSELGICTSTCRWILNFLTNRPQSVRLGNQVSSTLILNTGIPQGCVLSPLLYSLFTHNCAPLYNSNIFIKYADDTTVVGQIDNNDESAYREEIRNLAACRRHLPVNINGTEVERVSSFKFLGVHISEDLSWQQNTSALVKKAQQRLYFLRSLKKSHLSPRILTSFYRCVIESILTNSITVWYGGSTVCERKALQRVVKTAQRITGTQLPSIEHLHHSKCLRRAHSIIKDSSHPSHKLFNLLPSRRRYRNLRTRTSRHCQSYGRLCCTAEINDLVSKRLETIDEDYNEVLVKERNSCAFKSYPRRELLDIGLQLPDSFIANLHLLPEIARTPKAAHSTHPETWLHSGILDNSIELAGRHTLRADRTLDGSSMTRGGGLCIYVNKAWCTNSVIVGSHCSANLEFFMVKCRPFYLPREFTFTIITAAYIPPDADAKLSMKELYAAISKQQTVHPEAGFIYADYISSHFTPATTDVLFLNELNDFYARFERANIETATKLKPSADHSPIPLSSTDVCNSLSRISAHKAAGPNNIPGHVLRACAEQLAGVFTDIFNLSLAQAAVPSCFKCTSIVPVPKHSSPTCLNDYRPVALTPIVMKCFEQLVLAHLNDSLPSTLNSHQFAYRSNRSTEDARQLSIYYHHSIQGCVLSLFLYSLFTPVCRPVNGSNSIIKFADDTTVIGLITNNEETAYREEIQHLATWCNNNNLFLNISKTKELIVDFRKGKRGTDNITYISGMDVEHVSSFKSLGIHMDYQHLQPGQAVSPASLFPEDT
ncbi:gastrula zinc finger protein XlCGF28.1-like [Silurus asotus]|uniref:ribonuclease H n=1 Tax=Silurus asotus TaxID=30991 RepID=A0AAD5AGQ6_SILAS|nr:gastrula zinc finger protein XlCGF28.1-like [Silurus asotus]